MAYTALNAKGRLAVVDDPDGQFSLAARPAT